MANRKVLLSMQDLAFFVGLCYPPSKSPLDTETNDHYLLLNLGWFAQFEDAVVFFACYDYDLKNCY